jgi:hypothetical protein
MKKLILIFLLFSTIIVQGQNDNPDFANLVKLSELYSNDHTDSLKYLTSLEELRTINLNHIIDIMILLHQRSIEIFDTKYLSKPSLSELKYWAVIDAIMTNLRSDQKKKENNEILARKVLSKEIDSRNLLVNYYNFIFSSVGYIFNTEDLSHYNFDLNSYDLENETEKGIFYISLLKPMILRFRVLNYMKNGPKLLEYAIKLPKINNKPYFEYVDFNFEDFDNQYDVIKSYKKTELESYYSCLLAHYVAIVDKGVKYEWKRMYNVSILSKPEYYQYAGDNKSNLKKLQKAM